MTTDIISPSILILAWITTYLLIGFCVSVGVRILRNKNGDASADEAEDNLQVIVYWLPVLIFLVIRQAVIGVGKLVGALAEIIVPTHRRDK